MGASGLRQANRGRRLKTTSWKIFEMELQAYSALWRGLLDVKLHTGSCKTASAKVEFSLIFAFFAWLSLAFPSTQVG